MWNSIFNNAKIKLYVYACMKCVHLWYHPIGGIHHDYHPELLNDTVIFPAGKKDAKFNISVNNDGVVESSETFNIIIVPTSLPSGVTLGNLHEVTVTITDGM